MKQVTIKVEGFVTVTVPDSFMDSPDINIRDTDIGNIPILFDVLTCNDDEESCVIEVIETEITEKEISSTVNL